MISKNYRISLGKRSSKGLPLKAGAARKSQPHTEASLFHRRSLINYSNRSLFDGERENVSGGREKKSYKEFKLKFSNRELMYCKNKLAANSKDTAKK